MKIYTKTGDNGTTGLFAGPRVPKDHPRIAAYGSVDELNALLGIVAVHAQAAHDQQSPDPVASVDDDVHSSYRLTELIVEIVAQSQHDLFSIGAELATPEPSKHGTRMLGEGDVQRLENWIDRLDQQLPPLTNFIIPGGSQLAGWLHWAPTVCRRAEREVVHLTHSTPVEDCNTIIVYLNRLSDLLFVMARAANLAQAIPDVPWRKPRAKRERRHRRKQTLVAGPARVQRTNAAFTTPVMQLNAGASSHGRRPVLYHLSRWRRSIYNGSLETRLQLQIGLACAIC